MTIKVGDKLPAGTLSEYIEVEGNGCSVGPNHVQCRRSHEGQESGDLRSAGRIHANVFREARPVLPRRSTTS